MAKNSSSSSSNTLAGVLSGIFILLVALIAQFFLGIDVLNTDTEDGGDTIAVEETVSGSDWYSLYFTNPINTDDRALHRNSSVERALVESINGAQGSIDAAFYELNLESVTNALINAANRGVVVRLVVDDHAFVEEEFEDPEDSTFDLLENAGFELYCEDEGYTPSTYDMRCDDRSALMHHKFMIIDSAEIWMGSMNITHNGVYNNNNNFINIRSSRLAQNYQYMFDLMFEEGNFNLSGTAGYDVPNRRLTINGVPMEQYFSPDDGRALEARIIEEINASDSSVRVMVFGMTLDGIGDALLASHQRGVDVQAIFHEAGSIRGGQMSKLGCNDAPVKHAGNPDVLHHKVIVIDNEVVITGSFNFSAAARNDNSENVLIIRSSEIAQAYVAEFERLFNDTRSTTPSRAELEC